MRYHQFTTLEAAYKDQGIDPAVIDTLPALPFDADRIDFHKAVLQFDILQTSINKDEEGNEWKPQPGEPRYYGWFDIEEDETRASGFRLWFYDSGYDDSDAYVAPRLCFRDRARLMFAIEHHLDLFERIFIPR